ncbi:hypothetical protein [Undibacterium sp.]|uniref:hypothetical protein n=1 Tax=Undibacterium sp. TaxID=1914977 RepID=UPI0037533DE1
MNKFTKLSVFVFLVITLSACTKVVSPLNKTAVSQTTFKQASDKQFQSTVMLGQSTKADVEKGLGKTKSIHFDSDFEIWIYRYQGTMGAGKSCDGPSLLSTLSASPGTNLCELIILFNPAGVATKSRTRLVTQKRSLN